MHVISKRPLRQFGKLHPDAEQPLGRWFKNVKAADWRSFGDVRKVYGSADQVGRFTIFNVGGNKYRLITAIHFNRRKVYVRHVLTHVEYDRGDWKKG